MNYTGLRQGDGDFEGYISKGDLNANGLIDAYDISAVATRVGGGADQRPGKPLAGEIVISTKPAKRSRSSSKAVVCRRSTP